MSAGSSISPASSSAHHASCSRGARCPSRRGRRSGTATRCPATGSRACSGSGSRPRPPRRTSGVPHDGQVFGIFHRRALFFRLESTGPTISGITSPARRTMTVSPLAHVLAPHLVLVVQRGVGDRDAADRTTGSSTANGVTLPVRPVCTSIFFSSAVRSSGGNLYAIAHRGAWLVVPSSRCSSVWSTLITAPSISQSIECRCSSQCVRNALTSVDRVRAPSVVGGTGSPAVAGPRPGTPDASRTRRPRRRRTSAPTGAAAATPSPSGPSVAASPPRRCAGSRTAAARLRSQLLVQLARTPSPGSTSRRGPRSARAGPSIESVRGTPRTVRTLAVMSSPIAPSPRVAPCTSRPRSYVSAHATPSIFSSHANRAASPTPLLDARRPRLQLLERRTRCRARASARGA